MIIDTDEILSEKVGFKEKNWLQAQRTSRAKMSYWHMSGKMLLSVLRPKGIKIKKNIGKVHWRQDVQVGKDLHSIL